MNLPKTAFLFCTAVTFYLGACTAGTKPNVRKEYLQVFYEDGIPESTATKTLDFIYPMWRNEGDSTQAKTIQLTKSGDTVNFRMVIAPDRLESVSPQTVGSFIQLMSDSLFQNAPVNIVLCDDHFREQKKIRYSETFRKPKEQRVANNESLYGKSYRAGTAEVYVAPGVDNQFGSRVASYLDESNGTGEVHASFLVARGTTGYVVKMVADPDFADKHPSSLFINMANMLSRDIFSGEPVSFVLADPLFNDMKEYRSESSINRPERSYTSVHHNRIIGDTLYQENIDIPSDISEPESRVTYPNAIKWTNGNLISNASPAGPNSPFILHEYNDHPNPLYTYYIPFPFEYALGDWGIPAYKNLITFAGGGLTRDVDPAKWDFDRYTYTYRKDGYPLTAVVDNNQGDNITVAYVYYSK